MKLINHFIQEKLRIDNNIKISNNSDILNKNINSINELSDVIEQYLKACNFDILISKVNPSNTKWETQYTGTNFIVDNHFEIDIYKGKKRIKQLRFAEYRDYFLMQLLVYNNGKPQYCRVHGASTYNEFKKGDNLLKFIEIIIRHTKEGHPVDKDPNLVELFKDL